MKGIIILTALLTQLSFADTVSYQLYYDEEKTEILDIKVEVDLSGKFEQGSEVSAVRIIAQRKNKEVVLFDVAASDIKATWTAEGTLELTNRAALTPAVTKTYIPYHSDTNINPEDDYSLNVTLDSEGSTAEFDVGNSSQEEMGLSGYLKRIQE